MKAKYCLIYAAAGVAFLAVSLWVLISRGNNPKAVSAKYKLGGIMLIAWTIIASASCTEGPLPNTEGTIGTGGEIMCYDPAPSNCVNFSTDKCDKDGLFYYLAPGEYLSILIEGATYKEFSVAIYKMIADKTGDDAVGELLQKESVVFEENLYSYRHKIEYSPADKGYEGQAIVRVWGLTKEDGENGELLVSLRNLIITRGED